MPTGGSNPRNFGLDPTGTYLIAGNHSTDDIFTFRVDPDTGKLTPTRHKAEVVSPVCHKLIPVF